MVEGLARPEQGQTLLRESTSGGLMARKKQPRRDETTELPGQVEPRPGTRMLEIPPPSACPFKLAEEQVEKLRRQEAKRVAKKKREKE